MRFSGIAAAVPFKGARFGPHFVKAAPYTERWRRACAGARAAPGWRRTRPTTPNQHPPSRPRHRRHRARRRARRRWTTAATARRSMLWRRRLILFCREPRAGAARKPRRDRDRELMRRSDAMEALQLENAELRNDLEAAGREVEPTAGGVRVGPVRRGALRARGGSSRGARRGE